MPLLVFAFLLVPDPMITPEQFAQVLCDDLDLPTSSFAPAIVSSVKQQVEQFTPDMIPEDEEDRRVIIKVTPLLFVKMTGLGTPLFSTHTAKHTSGQHFSGGPV